MEQSMEHFLYESLECFSEKSLEEFQWNIFCLKANLYVSDRFWASEFSEDECII